MSNLRQIKGSLSACVTVILLSFSTSQFQSNARVHSRVWNRDLTASYISVRLRLHHLSVPK